MRVVLLAFLALVVPYIGQSHSGAATKWMDMSGLGPLVVVPLGLLVGLLCPCLCSSSCGKVLLVRM